MCALGSINLSLFRFFLSSISGSLCSCKCFCKSLFCLRQSCKAARALSSPDDDDDYDTDGAKQLSKLTHTKQSCARSIVSLLELTSKQQTSLQMVGSRWPTTRTWFSSEHSHCERPRAFSHTRTNCTLAAQHFGQSAHTDSSSTPGLKQPIKRREREKANSSYLLELTHTRHLFAATHTHSQVQMRATLHLWFNRALVQVVERAI